MTTDLFAEFGETAAEYGWRGLGQPERLVRRFGKGEVSVHVYANRAGTAITGATRVRLDTNGRRTTDHLTPTDRDKRDRVLDWLRS